MIEEELRELAQRAARDPRDTALWAALVHAHARAGRVAEGLAAVRTLLHRAGRRPDRKDAFLALVRAVGYGIGDPGPPPGGVPGRAALVHPGPIRTLEVGADGRALLTADAKRWALWDPRDGRLLASFPVRPRGFVALAPAPALWFEPCRGGFAGYRIDAEGCAEPVGRCTPWGGEGAIRCYGATRDGEGFLVWQKRLGVVRRHGRVDPGLPAYGEPPADARLSRDETRFLAMAAGGPTTVVSLHDTAGGARLASIEVAEPGPRPSGRRIFERGPGGGWIFRTATRAFSWDPSGRLAEPLPGPAAPDLRIAIRPDGLELALASAGRITRLALEGTGARPLEDLPAAAPVEDLAYSADGALLLYSQASHVRIHPVGGRPAE